MKLKPQHRLLQTKDAIVDPATRTVRFPFSSETPVERYYGDEILSHAKGAMRTKRLNDGAPLLFNHNLDDVIGVVEEASVDGGRGYATVRFAKTARADEIMAGIDDKIYRNVSMWYRIHKVEEETKSNTFRMTDWEPLEISIVSVPADPTVGIGRDYANEETEVEVIRLAPETPAAAPAAADPPAASAAAQPAAAADNTGAIRMAPEASAAQSAQQPAAQTAQQLEEARVKAIRTLCKANNLDDRFARDWATRGLSIELVADEILKVMEERGKIAAESPAALGMEKKEVERWSLHRAIRALEAQDWSKAGLELATSQAVQQKTGRAPTTGRSILVPIDVLARPMTASEEFQRLMERAGRRDLTVASLSGGGYLVDTQNQGFIDMLRNSTVCYPMGARRLAGLQGNVTIPKRTAGATGYWLASESTAITESGQTFGQLSLSPKTVGAYNEISRLLVMQSSPDAEAITMSGLAMDVGLAMDLGALTGDGTSGKPTGLLNVAGLGSVADAAVDYADIIEFQTDVAAANALSGASSAGYVMAPATAGLLKQRVKFSNTASPLWEGRLDRGQVDGYPAMSSNQLSAQIIFGDWSQMIIAEWGVLEIALNPAANFPAGIVGVRAMYTVDVGLRYSAAFSAMASAS